MSADVRPLRYNPGQVAEAIGQARADGRWWLVQALVATPEGGREAALASVLDHELRPDERGLVLAELARLNPHAYLTQFAKTGLRSRSIGTQQVTIAILPRVLAKRINDDVTEEIASWLNRRLNNPRRDATWATWEVPAAALALLPSLGRDRVMNLLDSLEAHFQPEEVERWHTIRGRATDSESFTELLDAWRSENMGASAEAERRDPTAEISVDRVMKRLGYRPANPTSDVYDSLANSRVPMFTIDATSGSD